VFVHPEARGTGHAEVLVIGLIEQAKVVVEELQLSVVTTNTAAALLYTRLVFGSTGWRSAGLRSKVAIDDLLMFLQWATSG